MKRRAIAAAVLFPPGAFALASVRALLVWNQPSVGPISSLAQVQAGLYRNPQAWAGRTIRVRAQLETLGGGMGRRSPSQAARRFMTIC